MFVRSGASGAGVTKRELGNETIPKCRLRISHESSIISTINRPLVTANQISELLPQRLPMDAKELGRRGSVSIRCRQCFAQQYAVADGDALLIDRLGVGRVVAERVLHPISQRGLQSPVRRAGIGLPVLERARQTIGCDQTAAGDNGRMFDPGRGYSYARYSQ